MSIDELDEMLIYFRHLDEVNDGEFRNSDYSETPSEDSDQRRQIIRRNRDRLRPFYANRKDILTHFDDEKLRKTFRFDRDSINFITGIYNVLPMHRY